MNDEDAQHAAFRSDLGARIAKIAARFPTKTAAAETAGVSLEQLNKWIRGEVKVPFEGLKALADAVNVDFSWFLDGGESRSDVGTGFLKSVDTTIIGEKVGELVVRLHKENGVKLPEMALIREVMKRIAQLQQMTPDGDMEELFALLPWLELQIKRDLMDAVDMPGSGKHSAS